MGKHSYATQRLYRDMYLDIRTPTEAEKIAMGLIKKPAIKGTIHIVVPEHYGSKGVMWASRFVTEAELEGYAHQYPNMQILDEKYKVKREEVQNDKTNRVRDQGIC